MVDGGGSSEGCLKWGGGDGGRLSGTDRTVIVILVYS